MAVLVVEHDPAVDETHHVEVGSVDIGVLHRLMAKAGTPVPSARR